jgi:anionic cell wall polymer biosynthesis LytR-Cps2A-Psr (LCP) family protein
MAKEKKKNSGKKILLTIAAVVLAIILVVGIGVTIYINSLLDGLNQVENGTQPTMSSSELADLLDDINQGFTEGTGPAGETTPAEPAPTLPKDERIINIMLVGQDQRKPGEAKLSDTMILCTINMEKKTLTMTSFLRDMYVKLPDYNGMKCGHNRINVNYALGGMGMLNQCLLENFGIKVEKLLKEKELKTGCKYYIKESLRKEMETNHDN